MLSLLTRGESLFARWLKRGKKNLAYAEKTALLQRELV
jgi:hypothetical protein